jgi:hypothetical protein
MHASVHRGKARLRGEHRFTASQKNLHILSQPQNQWLRPRHRVYHLRSHNCEVLPPETQRSEKVTNRDINYVEANHNRFCTYTKTMCNPGALTKAFLFVVSEP